MNISQLRGRIAESGIRRQDLAEQLGYSESTFSLYMTGKRPAPDDFAEKLLDALDRLERAEAAAREARQKVLEGEC